MTNELMPKNGRHLAHGFSPAVYQRGLELMLECGSVHQAQLQLEQELRAEDPEALVPQWRTMIDWAHQHEDVITRIHRDRKRDMIALGYDASIASGQRMLEALPNLPDSQIAVPHGIIWQKTTDLLKDGAATVQAVQVNITTGGKKLED